MQTVRVRTTQNVLIEYSVASIGDRILAYFIDRFILVLYSIAVAALLVQLDAEQWYVWLILLGVPWLFYNLAFEILMNGQGPGKRVMKIQVVQLNGTTPTIGNYLLRWIFAFVDFYMLSGAIAVVCIALGGKGQRLGDMVAGTAVVKLLGQEEVSAKDIFVTTEERHEPTFAQVVQLTPSDIEIIQRALEVYRDQGISQPVIMVTQKVKDKLGIQSERSDADFLNTILKDYSVLTSGQL
ncbi:MAG: RDD family protein [Chryseolinea sp.]